MEDSSGSSWSRPQAPGDPSRDGAPPTPSEGAQWWVTSRTSMSATQRNRSPRSPPVRSCGTHLRHLVTSTRSSRASCSRSRSRQRGVTIDHAPKPAGQQHQRSPPSRSSVGSVTDQAAADEQVEQGGQDGELSDLIPMLRRIVGARVGHHPSAEDLVQETLVRVLAARDRIEPGMVEPYAIATVRNLVASMWRQEDRDQRNRHRAHDPGEPERGEDVVIASEESAAMAGPCSASTSGNEGSCWPTRSTVKPRAPSPRTPAARPVPSRPSSSEPVPACGSSTCLPSRRSSPRPSDADRSCSPCPVPTGGASARSMRPSTCSSASSAPGSAGRCSTAGRCATTRFR